MSGVLKGIKKVFSKVWKVAKVVLPIALAAAAVVFTGGAALGLGGIFAGGFSGAVGSLVGGLGLSSTLAGALTGSIVSAGFGGAAGFLLSGGKMKGLQSGTAAGALTGGILGAASPATFGIGANGARIASTTAGGVGGGGGGAAENGLMPGSDFLNTASVGPGIADTGTAAVAPVAAPAIAPTAAPVGAVAEAAKAGGNGIMSGFLSNPTNTMVAGSLLQGLFSPNTDPARANERVGERLFSDIYSTGEGDPGQADYGPGRVAVRAVRRYRLNPENIQVEEVANG